MRAWRTHAPAPTAILIALAVALGTLVVMAPAQPVRAEPTLADVERQVGKLEKAMAVATEEYNDARARLATSRAELERLRPRVREQRAQVRKRQAEVNEVAHVAYRSGNLDVLTVMLTQDSPQRMLDQLTVLSVVRHDRQAKLDGLIAAKHRLEAQEKAVRAQVDAQAEAERLAKERQASVTRDLQKWNRLRAKLAPTTSRAAPAAYDGQGSGKAAVAVRFAYAQQGKPYKFGAAGPHAYDCSGLTKAAWRQAGVSMPHSARRQYAAFRKVATSQLVPGDLVFYGSPIHHVAIYVGQGKVIHAPRPGDHVRLASVAGPGRPVGAARPG